MRHALALLLFAGCGGQGSASMVNVDLATPDMTLVSSRQPTDPPALPDLGSACGTSSSTGKSPCGGKSACSLIVDETVPAAAGIRTDAPAVTIDASNRPVVFFSLENTSPSAPADSGTLARRESDATWTQLAISPGAGSGSFATNAGGPYAIVLSDGVSTTRYTPIDDLKLGVSELVDNNSFFNEGGLAVDGKGCAYVGMASADSGFLRIARRSTTGTWDYEEPLPQAVANPRTIQLAVGPDGHPQAVFWDGVTSFALTWLGPNNEHELVEASQLPQGDLVSLPVALTVGADNTPYVLFTWGNTVLYATRENGQWTSRAIGTGTPAECPEPTMTGQTCSTTATAFHLLGAATSADGAVRFAWVQSHETTNSIATCVTTTSPDPGQAEADLGVPANVDLGSPSQPCSWNATTTATSDLFVSSPDQVATAPSFSIDGEPTAGSMAFDNIGRIHIVAYDEDEASTFPVRYFLLGPSASPM